MRSIRQLGVGYDGVVTVLYEEGLSDVFDISKLMEGAQQTGAAMESATVTLDKIATALMAIHTDLDSLRTLLADYVNYNVPQAYQKLTAPDANPHPEDNPFLDMMVQNALDAYKSLHVEPKDDGVAGEMEPIERMEVDRG